MGSIEIPCSGHPGGSCGADSDFAGLGRGPISPVDGVIKRFPRGHRRVVESRIGYHVETDERKQLTLAHRQVVDYQRRRHVGDLGHKS